MAIEITKAMASAAERQASKDLNRWLLEELSVLARREVKAYLRENKDKIKEKLRKEIEKQMAAQMSSMVESLVKECYITGGGY